MVIGLATAVCFSLAEPIARVLGKTGMAAACGCPLVMGPHTFNFAQAAELALAAGAAVRVADLGDAVKQALRLIQSPQQLLMRQQALAFAAAHRGAATRMARSVLEGVGRSAA